VEDSPMGTGKATGMTHECELASVAQHLLLLAKGETFPRQVLVYYNVLIITA
jgi:hypothetical protein